MNQTSSIRGAVSSPRPGFADHRPLNQIQHELAKIKTDRADLDRKEALLVKELEALQDATLGVLTQYRQ